MGRSAERFMHYTQQVTPHRTADARRLALVVSSGFPDAEGGLCPIPGDLGFHYGALEQPVTMHVRTSSILTPSEEDHISHIVDQLDDPGIPPDVRTELMQEIAAIAVRYECDPRLTDC
jgi:hypothetical protein